MLVSWEDWWEQDNTCEPVRNLPPDMVAAFGNHGKKQKTVSSAMESDSPQNLLLQEISKRVGFLPKQRRWGEHLPRRVYTTCDGETGLPDESSVNQDRMPSNLSSSLKSLMVNNNHIIE